jgi:TRAP-type mannitol/chloroaromatic compound transport system permease small subunit
MSRLIGVIDFINDWSGKTVSWLVLVFTLVLGYEIVLRYVFNAPTKWAFDISYMLGGTYFWLGAGYTMLKKKHVRIDIFYRNFSPAKKAWTDIFFSLIFFFPLWGILLYQLIPYVYLSWVTDERSMQGYWMPILYPFKTVMPLGVLLLVLQGVAEFLRAVLVLTRAEGSHR